MILRDAVLSLFNVEKHRTAIRMREDAMGRWSVIYKVCGGRGIRASHEERTRKLRQSVRVTFVARLKLFSGLGFSYYFWAISICRQTWGSSHF